MIRSIVFEVTPPWNVQGENEASHYNERGASACEVSAVAAVVPGVSNFIQTRASHSAKLREGGPRSDKKEYSHEGRINHRSAIRCSDLRDGSNFPAGNITRCCGKYRYCASHHLWPRAASKPSSGSSRLPPNSACCSSRRYHRLSVRWPSALLPKKRSPTEATFRNARSSGR